MVINKLSEYISYIENLPREFILSRGQFRNYELLPGALRKDSSGNRKYTKRTIRNFLEQFKINAYQYMTTPWDIMNEVEWMLHAQHYGIPTKLLDFTTSHITSILFAIEKSFQVDIEENAVVYFLNPFELNQKNKKQSTILNIKDLSPGENDLDGPVAINGRKLNTRINAQKGMFVLFQDDDVPLEATTDENVLRKVEINKDEMMTILASLHSIGIGFTHVYPELDSVSKDIIMEQDINDYLKEND